MTSAVSLVPGAGGLAALVDALVHAGPGEDSGDAGADKPQSMAGFREDFASLMSQDLGLTKVVVLVDDLDRCLPPAAVGTLEAIKLFLSVKKMAFVLAADEDLVRASIDRHLGGLAQGEFANRYTEKIVQLPISLPRLSQHDAEAFVALLLGAPSLTGEEHAALTERARTRRREGKAPYVVPDPDGAAGPTTEALALADAVATGLSADSWQTPRAVKRFLNSLAVREHISRQAGAELPLPVLVRLYVLELRHLPEFKTLAAQTPDGRTDLLARWEEWARDEDGEDKPAEVDAGTKAWAAGEPRLAGRGVEIDRYLTVAATLRADVRLGGTLDAGQLKMIERLLDGSDMEQRAAVTDTLGLSPEQQDSIVGALGNQVLRAEDPERALDSLMRLARAEPRLVPVVSAALERTAVLRRLEPQHIPLLGALPRVLTALAEAEGIDEAVRLEARRALGRAG